MASLSNMLFARALYSSQPPSLQTKTDMNPTLLVSWWCTLFALVAILIRVAGRFVRTEKLFREDKIMFCSIIPLLIRMGLVHVILIWGTNNTVTTGLSALDIRHREIGSKLVLASRIFYAAFLWVAKYSLVEFLKRLIGASWHKSYQIGMRVFDGFLILTFLAVVISTVTECHPFPHYYQVVPDPGPMCREGLAQLITMGICNIMTDLALVIAPVPLVLSSAMPIKRKISLISLFFLSLILVGITCYRIPATISRHSSQQFRSLLASIEILAASAVANAVVIGSFIRDRGMKKAKFRAMSVGNSSERDPTLTRQRTKSIAQHHWGSDEDLVAGLGMSVVPALQHRNTVMEIPRVAPVAIPNHNMPAQMGESSMNRNWNFTNATARRRPSDADSVSTASTDLKLADLETNNPNPGAAQPDTPGKLSFFDVGGLVDSSTPPGASRDSSIKDQGPSPVNPVLSQASRQSSRAFLSDVGGLMASHPEEGQLQPTSRLTAPAPDSIDRRGSSQQFRNFLRGGPGETIAEHEAPPTARAQRNGGSDMLDFSDAGGLLG